MDINFQLIDSIDASIYWKDLEGVYLGCNKYMLIMAGLKSRSDIIGKTDYQMPWRKLANKIRDIDNLVVANHKNYELEEYPIISGGSTKTFLSSKAPLIADDNSIIGIIGVSIDITEKKRLEELLQLTENSLEESTTAKERFLKNISHETRNPLQAFVCTAEALADKWNMFSDKQRYDAIKLIASSSRRLASLVNNTFDLSDLINGNVKLILEKLNITELVKEIITSFNNESISGKKPKILMKGNKDHYLVFDKIKITQVLNNLLGNAIKWTLPDKTITIELHEGYLPNSSISGIQCCIKDQGVNIPEKQLEFIFEAFTESSNTASKACGIGLGLPICKEIIKLHMGEIWAENNTTAGSTFNFIIPNILNPTI